MCKNPAFRSKLHRSKYFIILGPGYLCMTVLLPKSFLSCKGAGCYYEENVEDSWTNNGAWKKEREKLSLIGSFSSSSPLSFSFTWTCEINMGLEYLHMEPPAEMSPNLGCKYCTLTDSMFIYIMSKNISSCQLFGGCKHWSLTDSC